MFSITTVSQIEDGELGLGHRILVPDFTLLVPFIGDIFTDLIKILEPNVVLKYGFYFWPEDKKRAQYAIDILKKHLPKGVHFYTIDGRELFDCRSECKGVNIGITCYLVASH